MKYLYVYFFCFSYSFFLYASPFIIKENNNDYSIISLNIGGAVIERSDGFDIIVSESKGNTQDIGQPQLPTYTFNYSIDYDKNYTINLETTDYIVYENINLLPAQAFRKINEEKIFIKDTDFYNSNTIYPEKKIKSKRMSLRGYELLSIEIIPYEYNPKEKQLKVFTNVDIIISESGDRDNNQRTPRSQAFESMYKNYVINSEDYQDSRSFQKPSVLYICGGNVADSEYLETLTDWRHKQGYVVNVISSDDAGGSTTNIKNYISNAYNNWENPPEHVCFIGDANGSIDVPTYTVYGGNGWSTAQGEGDFPYSLLEGNDLLPEVTLGRISIRSTTELITVINKIIGYEKNYANDFDWLNAIALVGDPNDSGISTVITNQYIEQIVQIHGGMSDIRTKYSGGNDFDDWMRNQINDGVGYLNYRGFYGFSGFTSNDVGQLNNGYKLPFIVTLTCGTGSFATETTCLTESLYRAGTSVSPKGAIAVVGTAQSYTHTAFNNIVDMGIFEGIFINGAQTVGEAVVHGKLAINEIYPQNPNDNVYLFSTWNNLLGDPALQLWTSSPQVMVVQHNQMLINGSNNFQVIISDQQGDPIEGVMVTLSREDDLIEELFESGYTNSNGIADFSLHSSMSSGTVNVVSRMQNYIPDESFFIISNDLPEMTVQSISINDSSGNNDGYLNPSETAILSIEITNNSDTDINFLIADCNTNSQYITLSNNSNINIGTLASNASTQINNISISSANTMSDTDDPMVRLTVYSTSDDLLWNYVVPIDFKSANLELSYTLNSDLSVGGSSDIAFEIENSGSMSLEGLTGEINYNGSLLTFSDNIFSFGAVGAGENIHSIDDISISADNAVINGSVIYVPVNLASLNGYQTQSIVSFQVGNVTINDPVGPDANGYYIYDIGDTEYELAPSYDWIEIDPDYGGNGSEVNIYDGGNNQDDVTTISLPFAFTFYGITYNSVSICSNGWISFGATEMTSFRNYTLPGPGGPSPMVAVFWDDLKTTSGGEVYSYYSQFNDSFIIEWSGLRTYLNNSSESFQIILYNSGDETPTGDDEIKLQYNNFNNTSIGDYPVGNYEGAVIHGQYCTVGIENHLANDGLQYTFNNSYASGARTLTDQSALFITTRGSTAYAQPEASYNTDEFIFNISLGEQYSEQLTISNNGEFGSELIYEISSGPYPVSNDQVDDFGYAWMDSRQNSEIINYNWIDIQNENNITILEFENNDTATEINIGFDFPFYDQNYTTCLINPNGWIGFEEDDEGWNNQAVFDEESPNAAIFAFWDDLNPAYSGNEVGSGEIKYQSDSNRLVIWFDNVIHWADTENIYNFQLILYKSGEINVNYESMQGEVESATIGIRSPIGENGLEVVYNDSFIEDNLTLSFNTSKWLSSSFLSGNPDQLSSGSSATYMIDIDTNNLSSGVYYGYIINNTNALNNLDIIPVTLNTQSSFLYGDINQDGIIDVIDVVVSIQIIMGEYDPSSLEELLGDLNEDGTINVQDIILLVNIILSI